MIVLDTNVLSELMRRQPATAVVAWLDRQSEPPWITSITVQEIEYGIERLRDENRRAALRAAFDRALAEVIEPRILVFDEETARAAGRISARRERDGQPIHIADSQIAAIARCSSATLVTRDPRDFAGLDLDLINPWEASAVHAAKNK
jgi:predicted nucleic acid-binding protein